MSHATQHFISGLSSLKKSER